MGRILHQGPLWSFMKLSTSYQARFTATGMLQCQVFTQLHRKLSSVPEDANLFYVSQTDPHPSTHAWSWSSHIPKRNHVFRKSLWYCVCGICLFFPQHNFVQQYVDALIYKTALIYFFVLFATPKSCIGHILETVKNREDHLCSTTWETPLFSWGTV